MNDFPQTLKITTVWLIIGVLVFLGAMWLKSTQEESDFTVNESVIEIQRARDGHYYWRGEVNGYPVKFLIDTGATITSIPKSLADKANLPIVDHIYFETANGRTFNPVVKGDLLLSGGVNRRGLRVGVLSSDSNQALLGMDVLSKLRISHDAGVMRFEP